MALTVRRMLINTEKAQQFLATNVENRRIIKERVRTMADDMKNGRWRETHQGIGIDINGDLRDGQHRLSAVVLSGCPQWFWVFEGLTAETVKVIDCGKLRSISDVLTIDGYKVKATHVAVARRLLMDSLHNNQRLSRFDIMEAVGRHWDAIAFATGGENHSRTSSAPILAVIARAWYTRDRDRLVEFKECLRTGVVPGEEDSAAAALYRFCYARDSSIGSTYSRSLYLRTCTALHAFLERRPLAKIHEAAECPFPLPPVIGPESEPAPDRKRPTRAPRKPLGPPELFS